MMQPEDRAADVNPAAERTSVICHRCGATAPSGCGAYYVVRIEATADPTPPNVDTHETATEMAAEYELLIAQMSDMSERELMDQVHRRMVIHLCSPCYTRWIDNPTG